MEHSEQKLLDEFQRIKLERRFKTVDTHFHPFDVMGVLPPNACEYSKKIPIPENFYNKKDLLEIFKYDRVAKIGTSLLFNFVPGFISDTISKTYSRFSPEEMFEELKNAGIDDVCLMPIEPWVRTEQIFKTYQNNNNVHLLGSIDIHHIKLSEVENALKKYKYEYGIVGLKLHPNLQNFHPSPSKNSEKISKILKKIYATAESEKLYLHFHGGATFFTQKTHEYFGKNTRSKQKALMENFINTDLLGQYDVPIVIAHAASYAVADLDKQNVMKAIKIHPKLFFDTSGTAPRILSELLKVVGPERVVFGSDGPYNRVKFNLIFLLQALKNSSEKDSFDDDVEKVFSKNFFHGILK